MFQKATADITKTIFGVAAFVISLIFYLLTVQRTVPMWDCGEFIACAYTLGVAHPPGTPLFLLIARLASLLPIASDVGHRINLLSAFSGAAAAAFGYAVSVRLLRFMPGVEGSSGRRLAVYLCSFIGALLFAFSRTNWSSAVEAEVYSLAMMLTFLLIWLSLRWYDTRGSLAATKYLILIAYLAILSVAIHMTVFLVAPAVFLFIILADESLRKDYRFWISGIVLFLVTVNVTWFIGGALIWFLITLISYLSSRARSWALALGLTLAALVGYSVHYYVWIRASQNPSINQNNPQTWDRFKRYVERKQYGEESMLSKMFRRRASWAHQLGDFPRIGFGGYLVRQWGMTGFVFIIPFVLGLIGVVSLIKWKWRVGAYIALLLFACTIGLVLYMNFSDGSLIDPLTGNDKLEVRDRDYFFTPGFILFGLCIGVGLFVVANWIIKKVGDRHALSAAAATGVAGLLMPVCAVVANYQVNDRSDNYFVYDYAYNFLMSCPEDAILFTNGDNDTFPLWCLQEAYGIRKDVRVANLSLIQTDWYQLQLKHRLGVPISLEDDQMLWERVPAPRGRGSVYRPKKPFIDHLRGGWEHYLMAFQDTATGQVITVAHQMVENIIGANRWKYPLLFANGYPTEVRYPLTTHVRKRGWLDEIIPEESRGTWDVEKSMDLFTNVFKMRGLDNPHFYRDEVVTTLVIGAGQLMMDFVDFLESRGDTARASQIVDLVLVQIPEFWQAYDKKAQYQKLDAAQKDALYTQYFAYMDSLLAINPDNLYYYQYKALSLQTIGKGAEAISACEKAYAINPVVPVTYRTLLNLYMLNGRRDDAMRISRDYLRTNPGDPTARAVAAGRF